MNVKRLGCTTVTGVEYKFLLIWNTQIYAIILIYFVVGKGYTLALLSRQVNSVRWGVY
jgi:hypothetical protein